MMVLRVHRKEIMQCISIFTLVVCAARANQNHVPEIETHPSSLLVPVGTTAVFECKVRHCPRTCSVYWTINGLSTAHDHQQDRHEDQGFIFENQHNTTTSVFYSKLAITASVSVNNTELYCIVQDGIRISDRAILIVASETPLAPNPSVKTMSCNSTIFLLEWSPPFLWPGYHIEYFNVIVTNQKNDRVVHHTTVNASFDDIIVSLIIELDAYSHDLSTCTEFLFTVEPDQIELPPFSVIRRYLSPCVTPDQQLAVHVTDINTTVLFTNKVTPILEININLPLLICEHQMVNYSISTSAIDETVDKKSNDSINGPYLHLGPGVVSHAITSGLERDKKYSVTVRVWIESQMIESHRVPFNTHLLVKSPTLVCSKSLKEDEDILHYKIAIGACLAVIIVACLSFVGVVVCLYIHNKRKVKKLKVNDSTSRVCNAMVHNPIYDGPVYESVQTQFETLTKQSTSTSNTSACNSQPSTPTSSEKSIRYVDPPSSAHQASKIRSKSFLSHPSAAEGDTENIPRCTSVSVPVIKKIPKQRNKLHLTLTLTGTDSAVATEAHDHSAQNCTSKIISAVNPVVLRDMDDNYAILSPAAGRRALVGTDGCELSPEDTDKYKE